MRYKEMPKFKKVYYTLMTAITAIIIGFVFNISTIISSAESAGKITATTCNVRADASTTSASIGSKSKDETIKILGQKTGADGYVWYQIYVNATTVGYVRSDLAEITDGTTPGTVGEGGEISETDAGVTAVNPVSGTVSGGQAVRVRQDASTSSTIVSSAASGTTLTVNGTKTGSDGRDWYYVEYTSDGKNIKGFIRSDFVTLSGTLTPLTVESDTPAPTETETPTDSVETTEPATTSKEYDTVLENGAWMFYDYQGNQKYPVAKILDLVQKYENGTLQEKKGSATVVFLIIFIILTLGAGAAAVYFFLKLREAGDKSAFAEAEREKKARAARNGNAPTRAAGANGARPTGTNGGARPTGNGARPTGANGGARPTGATGARPTGTPTRATGANGAPTRPAGANGAPTRPAGANGAPTRPAGANGAPTRPAGANGAPTRPAGANGAPVRPVGASAPRPAGSTRPVQSSQPAPKPVVDDDDEFEFGFLNWDSDDKK